MEITPYSLNLHFFFFSFIEKLQVEKTLLSQAETKEFQKDTDCRHEMVGWQELKGKKENVTFTL